MFGNQVRKEVSLSKRGFRYAIHITTFQNVKIPMMYFDFKYYGCVCCFLGMCTLLSLAFTQLLSNEPLSNMVCRGGSRVSVYGVRFVGESCLNRALSASLVLSKSKEK